MYVQSNQVFPFKRNQRQNISELAHNLFFLTWVKTNTQTKTEYPLNRLKLLSAKHTTAQFIFASQPQQRRPPLAEKHEFKKAAFTKTSRPWSHCWSDFTHWKKGVPVQSHNSFLDRCVISQEPFFSACVNPHFTYGWTQASLLTMGFCFVASASEFGHDGNPWQTWNWMGHGYPVDPAHHRDESTEATSLTCKKDLDRTGFHFDMWTSYPELSFLPSSDVASTLINQAFPFNRIPKKYSMMFCRWMEDWKKNI